MGVCFGGALAHYSAPLRLHIFVHVSSTFTQKEDGVLKLSTARYRLLRYSGIAPHMKLHGSVLYRILRVIFYSNSEFCRLHRPPQ